MQKCDFNKVTRRLLPYYLSSQSDFGVSGMNHSHKKLYVSYNNV